MGEFLVATQELDRLQQMPSAAADCITSSTLCRIAAWSARASDREERLASDSSEAGNRAEHQPPLRPLAPNPAVSAPSTVIRSDGSARAR